MATYTIELRRVCEIYGREEVEKWFKNYEISDFLNQKQIDTINKLNVWNKDKLAKKIVNHYFMREIGFETPALFKHYAEVTMQELMERMLPIIYSNSLEYDPLESVDFDITETREITGNANAKSLGKASSSNSGESNSNSESFGEDLNIQNNTPQSRIQKQNLESGIYASNVGQNNTNSNIIDKTNTSSNSNSNSESNSESNSNTLETFTHHEYGNKGVLDSYQKMIMQYRETIFAVDMEIIKELNTLFMGLY